MDLRKPANGFEKTSKPITDSLTDRKKDERRNNSPEISAKDKYRQAKDECQDLTREFFEWFEREVLGRWNKYGVTPADLRDWHSSLYAKYKPEIVTESLQTHRAKSTNWAPKFAEICKLVASLRAKELAPLKREKERKLRSEVLARIESEKKQPSISLEKIHRALSPAELLQTYENNPFEKRWIDTHYPELIEKAISNITKDPPQELLTASALSRGS